MSEQTDLEVNAQPESIEDKTAKLNAFCDSGINLIKTEKYEDALDHFWNEKFSKSLGIDFGDSKAFFLHHDLTNPADTEQILDLVSRHSHFNHANGMEIKLAALTNSKLTKGGGKYYVPQEIWKDIALVHLEEWLHATQYISGKPLAGEADNELDVAVYMEKKGIKLTSHFLKMHGREQFFKEYSGA